MKTYQNAIGFSDAQMIVDALNVLSPDAADPTAEFRRKALLKMFSQIGVVGVPAYGAEITYWTLVPHAVNAVRKFSLTIPEDAWEPTGPSDEPYSRLLVGSSELEINGQGMHLEAHAVKIDKDGVQVGDGDYAAEAIEALFQIDDCAHETIEIRGREYVLIAFPSGV